MLAPPFKVKIIVLLANTYRAKSPQQLSSISVESIYSSLIYYLV